MVTKGYAGETEQYRPVDSGGECVKYDIHGRQDWTGDGPPLESHNGKRRCDSGEHVRSRSKQKEW